jgi:hypothetical protein
LEGVNFKKTIRVFGQFFSSYLEEETVFWRKFDSDKGIQEILNDLAACLREE